MVMAVWVIEGLLDPSWLFEPSINKLPQGGQPVSNPQP
jgi:hypothetical protein